MRRSPAVVDRKAIAEHAWADETDPLGSNAIDVQLSRLRAKLPDAGVRIVDRSRRAATGSRTRDRRRAAHRPSERPPARSGSRWRRRRSSRSPTSLVSRRGRGDRDQRNLTDQIDQRLADSLARVRSDAHRQATGRTSAPPGDRLGGAPLARLDRRPDGTILATRPNAGLPAGYPTAVGPTTATIGDAELRVRRRPGRRRYVVVGQTLDGGRPDAPTIDPAPSS